MITLNYLFSLTFIGLPYVVAREESFQSRAQTRKATKINKLEKNN